MTIPFAEAAGLYIENLELENGRNIIGTGLGLYLSRQIILAHRGKLWAENLKSGGCQFSFTLPITKEAV
jgi:signal transduction histidine kinase